MWSSGRAPMVLACVLVCALAPPADAQGTVRGEIALVQREGAEPADLRGVVVWLVPRDDEPAAGRPSTATIAMRHREFLPRVVTVRAGGSVAFPNEDPFSHNVFSSAALGPFDLGLYRRGTTRAAGFAEPGVYPIYCNIHSRMVSFVVAVPTPWARSADAEGRFAMSDVPAGEYVLHAWHERAARPIARPIAVPATGLGDVRLTLDARAWVDAPHLDKLGRPYAMMRADRY